VSGWSLETLKRLGRADATGLYRMAGFIGTLFEGLPARLDRPGGAWLVALGPGHLVNKVAGLGLEGPVPEAALVEIERAFAEVSVAPQVEVWPGADPGLQVMLEGRGYRPAPPLSVLASRLESRPLIESGPALERVGAGNAAIYERTVALGFMGLDDGEPGLAEQVFARGAATNADASAWLARVDGVPAGGGAMSVHDGVAALFGASTLPRFRRRGVQRALLEHRLAMARDAGCEVAFMKTAPGSGSERNARRAGFEIAGESVAWTRKAGE